MIHIFLKLGAIHLLYDAQDVCTSWHELAKEPHLFRCVDMLNCHVADGNLEDITEIALEAIDRSCGQLVEFSINHYASDQVLQRIADTSNSLRRLRFVSCNEVSSDGFIDAAKKLPSLEELEFCRCSFSYITEVIEAVGRYCPRLKYFRLNRQGVMLSPGTVFLKYNDEALAIAAHMPQLHRLNLFGNIMNEDGLRAILGKCLDLEYLDLRQCFSIDFKEDLLNKCREIKTLRLPNDSTDDYEFDAKVLYTGSHDDVDDEYMLEFDVSDDEY